MSILGTTSRLALATAVTMALAACDRAREQHQPSASRAAGSAGAAAAPGTVPAAVLALGTHAEDAYDAAKLGDWARARAIVDSLKAAAAQAEPTSRDAQFRAELRVAVASLDTAVAAHQRDRALRESNRLTRVGAELSRPFQPRVPTEVTLLDYYGRELEIWAAAGDTAKLRETRGEMQRVWGALARPLVEHNGGTEAARFSLLMTRLSAARRALDYAALATPVLDEVDNLERVFAR